jgi:hypothetical protein
MYIPVKSPFKDAFGYRARYKGFMGTCTAGQAANIDHVITEERYINGLDIILCDHAFGDHASLQVVDTTYTYAGVLYPAEPSPGVTWAQAMPDGVVLDTFGETWYVAADTQQQYPVEVPYPARILPGLVLRIRYASTGATDVKVVCNTYLHWKKPDA